MIVQNCRNAECVLASFNCPTSSDLSQYDLRAVLVHTGLPGRKQMYSYVQDTEGTWWKTVDHEVTEVNIHKLIDVHLQF